jgi:hypothetical protein
LPRLIRFFRDDGESRRIEAVELAGRLKDGTSVIVIDVREPDEFRTCPSASFQVD